MNTNLDNREDSKGLGNCPCGGSSYSECCSPFHSATSNPPTAERLMRARFSAFATANYEFLIKTGPDQHLERPEERDRLISDLKYSNRKITWKRLIILKTVLGQPNQQTGKVEFCAVYQKNKRRQTLHFLHEFSDFARDKDGNWQYTQGQQFSHSGLKPSDKCWCGSERQLRKCHPE